MRTLAIGSQAFRAMIVAGASVAMVCPALAGDDTGTAAAERLAKARAAYEQALAELHAAEVAFDASGESGEQIGERVGQQVAGATVPGTVDPLPMGVSLRQPVEPPAAEPGFFDWKGWKKSVDLGINGASGNSENFNVRAQLNAERKTSKTETTGTLLYRFSSQDGNKAESRLRLDVRNDWLPPEGSRIRWWAKGAYEYDEFQDWDHRVSGAAGIGYELIKNDKHTLVGRLGFGGSQTSGGTNDEFRPEAVAGLDYAYLIKDGHKFTAGTEALLDVSDTENVRVNSFAQYEILLDSDNGMVFKTGVGHRYDSAPGGTADRNDLDYYATLGWAF